MSTEQCFKHFYSQKPLHTNLKQPFPKIFLYFVILTISPILNLGSLSLISLLESIYVLGYTSTGFILVLLIFVFTFINYVMYTFFDIEVIYL